MTALCQRCNKAQATVHLLDIVPPDGEKRERHLCEQCATEEGVTAQPHESISNILGQFIKQASGMQESVDADCPECGTTFREFRNSGLLGCANDYHAFQKPLAVLIERAHEGATHHVGKTPARLTSEPSVHVRLGKLRRQMREAIDHEDYESAARLRDEVQSLESTAEEL